MITKREKEKLGTVGLLTWFAGALAYLWIWALTGYQFSEEVDTALVVTSIPWLGTSLAWWVNDL